jgi:hypothetical protein
MEAKTAAAAAASITAASGDETKNFLVRAKTSA